MMRNPGGPGFRGGDGRPRERSEHGWGGGNMLAPRPHAESTRRILAFGAAALLVSSAHAAEQRPAAFVDAATVVPGLVVEMRYAGAHNFVGAPVDGYKKPVCLLARPAAEALAQVQHDLSAQKLGLKV